MSKSIFRRCLNRVCGLFARYTPGSTTVRPWLHRLRGVKIGKDVFIGDDVYFDAEYPESIEIHEGVQISIRALIVAHTRGPGRVVIEKNAFIGPHVIVACTAGRTLRIGEGAVVSAGCVITRNVAPRTVLAPPPPNIIGRATVPLTTAKSMEEFSAGLQPVRLSPPARPEGKE